MKRVFELLLAAFVLFILWQTCSMMIDRPIVPSPSDVIKETYLIFNSKLLIHILVSTNRVIISIFLSILVAWPLGLLMGYFRRFDRLFSPLVYLIYPIPKIALLPIIMVLLGIGESSKIFILFIIIVFQILITIRDYIAKLDTQIYETLISMNGSTIDIFRHVLIPASVPRLFSALRISLATAFSVLFFAENFGTVYGLGYFIMDSMLRVNYTQMYSGILCLSLLCGMLFVAISLLENLTVKWRQI